jgi:hypothetical protein
VKKLSATNCLSVGGHTNFWNDSIKTIIESSLYGRTYFNGQVQVIAAVFAILIVLSIFLIVNKFNNIRIKNFNCRPFITLFLSIMVISFLFCITTLHHKFLGGTFLESRTAQFNIVLLSLIFIFLFNYTQDCMVTRKLKLPLFCFMFLSLFYIFHFYRVANFKYVFYDRYNVSTRELIDDLKKFANSKKKIRLGGTEIFSPSIEFYRCYYNIDWIEDGYEDAFGIFFPPNYKDKIEKLDFIYILNGYAKIFNGMSNIELIKEYNLSQSMLFMVKK